MCPEIAMVLKCSPSLSGRMDTVTHNNFVLKIINIFSSGGRGLWKEQNKHVFFVVVRCQGNLQAENMVFSLEH